MSTDEDTLAVVEGALKAGAVGVVFGRNIWQNPRPISMVRALRRVIHEGWSAAEAGEGVAEQVGDPRRERRLQAALPPPAYLSVRRARRSVSPVRRSSVLAREFPVGRRTIVRPCGGWLSTRR